VPELGYIDGVFETMSRVDNLHLKPRGFCAPQQPVQRKKLVQIVRKYISDHPEASNERTIVLVCAALSQSESPADNVTLIRINQT
jgi:hypothetical protein